MEGTDIPQGMPMIDDESSQLIVEDTSQDTAKQTIYYKTPKTTHHSVFSFTRNNKGMKFTQYYCTYKQGANCKVAI